MPVVSVLTKLAEGFPARSPSPAAGSHLCAVLIHLFVGHIINQMAEMIQVQKKKKKKAVHTHVYTHTHTKTQIYFSDPIYSIAQKQLHRHNQGHSEL